MVVKALKHYSSRLKPHFVSNVDGDHVLEIIKDLNPETTLLAQMNCLAICENMSDSDIQEWVMAALSYSGVPSLKF